MHQLTKTRFKDMLDSDKKVDERSIHTSFLSTFFVRVQQLQLISNAHM